jgi:hypothetical protein
MEGLKNGTRAPFFPLEADQLQDRCKMDSDPSSREVNGTDFGGREGELHSGQHTARSGWGGFLFGVGTSLKKYDNGKEHAAGQARAGFMRIPGAPGVQDQLQARYCRLRVCARSLCNPLVPLLRMKDVRGTERDLEQRAGEAQHRYLLSLTS